MSWPQKNNKNLTPMCASTVKYTQRCVTRPVLASIHIKVFTLAASTSFVVFIHPNDWVSFFCSYCITWRVMENCSVSLVSKCWWCWWHVSVLWCWYETLVTVRLIVLAVLVFCVCRYRKQVEEMQRAFNKTIIKLQNTSRTAEEQVSRDELQFLLSRPHLMH